MCGLQAADRPQSSAGNIPEPQQATTTDPRNCGGLRATLGRWTPATRMRGHIRRRQLPPSAQQAWRGLSRRPRPCQRGSASRSQSECAPGPSIYATDSGGYLHRFRVQKATGTTDRRFWRGPTRAKRWLPASLCRRTPVPGPRPIRRHVRYHRFVGRRTQRCPGTVDLIASPGRLGRADPCSRSDVLSGRSLSVGGVLPGWGTGSVPVSLTRFGLTSGSAPGCRCFALVRSECWRRRSVRNRWSRQNCRC